MNTGIWKPIETAPKDNTILMLCGRDEEDGQWIVGEGYYESAKVRGCPDTPGWNFWGGDPVYWMDLPQPPHGD